jgi:hypothetical protein
LIEKTVCIFSEFARAEGLDGYGRGTQRMRRLIEASIPRLRRSLACRLAGNLVSNDGDNFLVKNYVLRVLSPRDPHKVLACTALDFGFPDRSP